MALHWLKVDLRGSPLALPHDCGNTRARRLALRERLRSEVGLSGAGALRLFREVRALELREASESLQELN